jgi:hypothetical protein
MDTHRNWFPFVFWGDDYLTLQRAGGYLYTLAIRQHDYKHDMVQYYLSLSYIITKPDTSTRGVARLN